MSEVIREIVINPASSEKFVWMPGDITIRKNRKKHKKRINRKIK